MRHVNSFLSFKLALIAWHHIILADCTLHGSVPLLVPSFTRLPAHTSWLVRRRASMSLSRFSALITFRFLPSSLALDEALGKSFLLLSRLLDRGKHFNSSLFLYLIHLRVETTLRIGVLTWVEVHHLTRVFGRRVCCVHHLVSALSLVRFRILLTAYIVVVPLAHFLCVDVPVHVLLIFTLPVFFLL